MTEPMNPADQIWCRDLDGTGSLHMCSQEQDGAIEFVPREDYDKMRQDAAHQCRERVKEWDRAEALTAQLAAVTAERDELATAIDSIETSNGLTSNGNLWRFWVKKSQELLDKNKVLSAQLEAAIAERDAAVEAIQDAIAANPTELNLGNYAHDDVCKLQDEAIDVFQILNAAITTTVDKEPRHDR